MSPDTKARLRGLGWWIGAVIAVGILSVAFLHRAANRADQ